MPPCRSECRGGALAPNDRDKIRAPRLASASRWPLRRQPAISSLSRSGRISSFVSSAVPDLGALPDPTMRWVVGGAAPMGRAASASQMGRFETEWLVRSDNVAALADLPGQWIDAVHQRRQPKVIVLDMDSSDSPTYGEQEGSAYNGHFGCTCYHPLSVSTSLAIWSAAPCGTETSIRLMAGGRFWSRSCRATGAE